MTRIVLYAGIILFMCLTGEAQEVIFFSEGTGLTYYDQGIADVGNLGGSSFEHTYPPGLPNYNDKIPCSTTAFTGLTSLKFHYTSAPDGNWKASVFRTGWTSADLSGMDSLSFYAYSAIEVPASALPLIGLVAVKTGSTSDTASKLYRLSGYNGGIPASSWTRITFPLNIIRNDSGNAAMNFTAVKGVVFNQSESNNVERTILIDEITAFKFLAVVPPVTGLTGTGYDSHAELTWIRPSDNLTYRIDASFDGGKTFIRRGETTLGYYLDFVPPEAKNSNVLYRVITIAGGRESVPAETSATLRNFSDDELLDMLERYTFRYFWEGAHQGSGMAMERTDGDNSTVASGATGMGLMAMIAAHERKYRPVNEIKDRILKILSFLETCDRHHGAWSHWYNAGTGHTHPFSTYDDGGDIVETSFVAQALIALKNYFSGMDTASVRIREKADLLWRGIDFDWYRQGGQNVLYWHWSPNYGFQINMKVTGWSECLITYIMAASSPTHGIPREVYDQGWAGNGNMVSKRTYYNTPVSLCPPYGGPLFWIHYSHLGIDPHELKDLYADYWNEYVNTATIHYLYAVLNPMKWPNFGEKCWGLTASDDPYGYMAHQPVTRDNGTVSPTAALSSLPYLPAEVLKVIKYIYRERGEELFGFYGPYDAFNDSLRWIKKAYIGIDQGPIMVMTENYRSGLLWNNVMKDQDVINGLNKLNFQFRITGNASADLQSAEPVIFPNPCRERLSIRLAGYGIPLRVNIFSTDGRLILSKYITDTLPVFSLDCSNLGNGFYFVILTGDKQINSYKILIQK